MLPGRVSAASVPLTSSRLLDPKVTRRSGGGGSVNVNVLTKIEVKECVCAC